MCQKLPNLVVSVASWTYQLINHTEVSRFLTIPIWKPVNLNLKLSPSKDQSTVSIMGKLDYVFFLFV